MFSLKKVPCKGLRTSVVNKMTTILQRTLWYVLSKVLCFDSNFLSNFLAALSWWKSNIICWSNGLVPNRHYLNNDVQVFLCICVTSPQWVSRLDQSPLFNTLRILSSMSMLIKLCGQNIGLIPFGSSTECINLGIYSITHCALFISHVTRWPMNGATKIWSFSNPYQKKDMSQVMKVRLSCYLVLLSTDSKTR